VPKAILGSALFFFVAPFALAGLVPWWITRWELRPTSFGLASIRALGAVLIIAGLCGVLDSFARFAIQGRGTPAPVAPTQKLVVTGLYRYVRNPMYLTVSATIFGQALLFSDWRLVMYGVLLLLVSHVFVVMYEEPKLRRTYGAEYDAVRANVPRWLPRLTPWSPAD
jgi:protein-S-isoprenylcysteine O-methyltransferase Ste14